MSEWLEGYICGVSIGAGLAAVMACVLVWSF
jgi:hypothetical protein